MSSTSCSMRPCWSESPPRCKWPLQACWPQLHRPGLAGRGVCGSRGPFHIRVKKRNTFVLTMRFMDPEMEIRYSVEKEKQSGAAFSCSCVVLLCTALVEILIDPW